MANTFTPLKGSAFIVGDEWNLTVGENTRQALLALCFRTIELGGSRTVGIPGTGAQNVENWLEKVLPGADLQGFIVQARVQVRTDAAGTTVQPKIYDITNAVDHVVGSASSSTSWAEQLLTMTLPTATRAFKLMLVKNNADAAVYGIGHIEILMP